MNISDEKLSAFLDQELSQDEMDKIRDALVADEMLAERLACLSQVDHSVKRFAQQVDRTPIPEATRKLVRDDRFNDLQRHGAANVEPISLWARAGNKLREHVALAAGVALVLGFGAGNIFPQGHGPEVTNQWVSISNELSKTASGQSVTLSNGDQLQPYFSFTAGDGRFCRSYSVRGSLPRDEIACRDNGSWSPVTSVYTGAGNAGMFSVASANQLMEAAIIELEGGRPLSIEQEALHLTESE